MLINTLNILTEASLYLLLFGITFSNSATEIFAISIISFFVIKKISLRDFHLPKTSINIFLYILCGIIFITFLRSAYFNESVRGFIRIIKFTFLYFALVDFFTGDERRMRRAFWASMSAAFFIFSNGVFQSIYGVDFIRHKGFIKDDFLLRISASFVHPNDFAAYIIFIVPMTLSFFSKSMSKNNRIFLAITCLLGLYCLLKTSSRAAWLGFLVGIIVYFYIYKKKMSPIIPLMVVLFIALSPNGFQRMVSLFALEKNTVWERTQLWKGTWEMVKVHPFLGFGINTFSRYFADFKPAIYPDIRYTHNSYLQMWSEIGILGLSAFIAVILTVLKRSIKNIKKKLNNGAEGLVLLGLIAGYVAFLIQSGLDTNLYSLRLTTLFWVMSAYMMSINKLFEKGADPDPNKLSGSTVRKNA